MALPAAICAAIGIGVIGGAAVVAAEKRERKEAVAAAAAAAAAAKAEALKKVYQRVKLLGQGGFGAVYVFEKNNQKFAGKQVPKGCLVKREALFNEAGILARLKHKNIVQYFEFIEDNSTFYMVMELMESSLSDLVKKRVIPGNEAQLYTCGILDGLIYLHDNNVLHRDIKGPNVLLKVGRVAKLGDFGLAQYYEDGQSALSTKHYAATSRYMAPEVLESHEVGRRADIWAVGCTIYEMLCREPPLSELKTTAGVILQTLRFAQWSVTENSTVLRRSQKDFLQRIFVEKEDRPYARSLRKDIGMI